MKCYFSLESPLTVCRTYLPQDSDDDDVSTVTFMHRVLFGISIIDR